MSLPVIPFAHLPRKEWHRKLEKKPRDKSSWHPDVPPPSPKQSESESESEVSSSSSEYDLLEHIQSLLPEVVDGKVTKKADETHLEDLRVKKKTKNVVADTVVKTFTYVAGYRQRERDRRKHYLLKEYEEVIKKYDEELKKQQEDQQEKERRERLLEEYRREQRILRNSKKVNHHECNAYLINK
jgi:hypothetical protein